VVFLLSPISARSEICAWEVEEAARLGKRILPVICRPLEGVSPPLRLRDLNYIFFYPDPKAPGSGFGTGLAKLIAELAPFKVEHGDFLPDALSEPPTGPCSVFRRFSLPLRDRQVLGANLKCSESAQAIGPSGASGLDSRIAHRDGRVRRSADLVSACPARPVVAP
jgi:hypothetical protein